MAVLELAKDSEYFPIDRVCNSQLWCDHGLINNEEKLSVLEQLCFEAQQQSRKTRSKKNRRVYFTRKVVKYCYSNLLFNKRVDIRRSHPALKHVWLYEIL
jgi:hypothetical protein